MKFEFSVDEDETPPPSGFDLGHIDVWGSEGVATTRDRGPGGGVMIYLTVTLLLDGLRTFLSGKSRSYESTAVDSSFSLTFTRGRDGAIETRCGTSLIDRSPAAGVAAALHVAAKQFADAHLEQLPPDDAGREDLQHSVADFERFVCRPR
ncbi:hypothetical protein I3J14_11640 [Streptomyces sp. HB-N217]|uniref:hypothetical protein n=1 Tax=Streptomyces sp. HB-N217 TaxID=2792016 RepID=UPI0018D7ABBD|nr:hypothetical protein [Streptomyces sp. HB-N217]MBH5130811.1 hypothetical protein [Streptomyces sp. HB-N217]